MNIFGSFKIKFSFKVKPKKKIFQSETLLPEKFSFTQIDYSSLILNETKKSPIFALGGSNIQNTCL